MGIGNAIQSSFLYNVQCSTQNRCYSLSSFNHVLAARAKSGASRGLLSFAGKLRNPPKVCKYRNESQAEFSSPRMNLNGSQFSVQASSGRADVKFFEDSSAGLNVISVSALDSQKQSALTRFLASSRGKVLFMIALGMLLCNADRMVMSVAVAPLQQTYGWNSSFTGIVQSSFLWGYLLSSVVGGTLADHYGGKLIMAGGLTIWSLATVLTPWAASHSVGLLLAARALFGMAEGVAFPCMNILLGCWFPSTERATAVGLSMAGFHLGNVISLLVSPLLMSNANVSRPFLTFGLLGLLWLSVWLPFIHNDPNSHPEISKSELLYIQGRSKKVKTNTNGMPPLRLLLSKLPTWAIIVANFTNNWGYFVLLSWMPVYFKTAFEINLKQAAWLSAVPWTVMAFAGYVAGAISDNLIQKGYTVTFVRKLMQSIGFIGPGVALVALNHAREPSIATAWLTVALGLSAFSQAGFLLNMQDIAPRYAGFLHGLSNGIGTVAAIVGIVGAGYFVQLCGSFHLFLNLTAAMYFVSIIFWNLYSTGERVF